MYDLPFVPSEKPLIRHMSLVSNCLKLMNIVHSEEDEGAYISVEFMLQLMNSMEACKELWEELRQDALDIGMESDDPALQHSSIDPYRYEYRLK